MISNIKGTQKCKVIFRRYYMNAIVDVPLSKQLTTERLFVGQKLQAMCWPDFYYFLFKLLSTTITQILLNKEFYFYIPYENMRNMIMWLEWTNLTPQDFYRLRIMI